MKQALFSKYLMAVVVSLAFTNTGILNRAAQAASFSADMITTENGNRTINKIFLQDNRYRMDVHEDGKALTVLVDRGIEKTTVIDASRKIYAEFSNNDLRSLLKNPFVAYQHMVKTSDVKTLGKEIINGIACDKQETEQNGKTVMTAWVSQRLDFPVKLLNNLNGYTVELQRVKEAALNPDFFNVPSNFSKQEDQEPQAAKPKGKVAITGKETFEAPIGRRIGPGGVLTVRTSPEKNISLLLNNLNHGESRVTIHAFRNRKPVTVKSIGDTTINFKRIWDEKKITFEEQYNPDTLRLEVTKGMVYANVNQETPMGKKEHSRETFLKEPVEFGFLARPILNITCRVVGNSQDTQGSTLKMSFFKDKAKPPILSEQISLKNGQSKQWDFDAGQNIVSGEVEVKKGAVQLYLHQFSKKTSGKQQTAKKTTKPTYTAKAKAVTGFTVAHPYGTSKPLIPGADLLITVTGVSGSAGGRIDLFSDRKKTKKIDTFKFKLKKKQCQSFAVAGEKAVGWATVWVDKGSFKVKLDQSPNAKSVSTAKTSKGAAPLPPKTKETPPAASTLGKSTASNGTILNGEVPLMAGAKVLKEVSMGAGSHVLLKVPMAPEEILNFYKQAMTARGWQPGMLLVRGDAGVLQLKNNGRQLMIKAQGQGQSSKVSMALAGQ